VNPGNDLVAMIAEHGVGRVCTGNDAAELERLAHELVAELPQHAAASQRAKELWATRFSTEAAVRQIVRGFRG
jgi:hypothetical protein